MSRLEKSNRLITQRTLEKIPNELLMALGESDTTGSQNNDDIIYAAIVYERQAYAWLLIPVLIIGVMFVNAFIKLSAGVALGPILVGLAIVAITNGFKHQYYLIINEKELYFVVMEDSSILKIASEQVISIKPVFAGASFTITYIDKSATEKASPDSGTNYALKFKASSGAYGNWSNLVYAFLHTEFSSKLVNEAKLKRKYLGE